MTDLDFVLRRLRDSGFRITKARQTVLAVICASDEHLTSSEILQRVAESDPSIGRASVFRTLEMLTAQGIVRPTYLSPRTPTYVLMSQQGHHSHIVCSQCNQIIEIDECHVDDLIHELEARYDCTVSAHLLEFFGACEDCRRADANLN